MNQPTPTEVATALAQIEQRESPRGIAKTRIGQYRERSVAVTDLMETRPPRQHQVWDRQRMVELEARHRATFRRLSWWDRLTDWLRCQLR